MVLGNLAQVKRRWFIYIIIGILFGVFDFYYQGFIQISFGPSFLERIIWLVPVLIIGIWLVPIANGIDSGAAITFAAPFCGQDSSSCTFVVK